MFSRDVFSDLKKFDQEYVDPLPREFSVDNSGQNSILRRSVDKFKNMEIK